MKLLSLVQHYAILQVVKLPISGDGLVALDQGCGNKGLVGRPHICDVVREFKCNCSRHFWICQFNSILKRNNLQIESAIIEGEC